MEQITLTHWRRICILVYVPLGFTKNHEDIRQRGLKGKKKHHRISRSNNNLGYFWSCTKFWDFLRSPREILQCIWESVTVDITIFISSPIILLHVTACYIYFHLISNPVNTEGKLDSFSLHARAHMQTSRQSSHVETLIYSFPISFLRNHKFQTEARVTWGVNQVRLPDAQDTRLGHKLLDSTKKDFEWKDDGVRLCGEVFARNCSSTESNTLMSSPNIPWIRFPPE